MSAPETVDASGRRWVLPYRSIEEKLAANGRVRVLLQGEGEATDLVFWARSRGYKVVRQLRTAAGMEVVIEAAKPGEKPAPAPRAAGAEARPARAPAAREAAREAGRPAPARVERAASPQGLVMASIEKVSRRMTDPLFRVDLLLVGTTARTGEAKAPLALEALIRLAAEASGGGCAHLEATHSGGSRVEMIVCEGKLEGIVYYDAKGLRAEGSKAVTEASKAFQEEGRVEYRIMRVTRDFVEKLKV